MTCDSDSHHESSTAPLIATSGMAKLFTPNTLSSVGFALGKVLNSASFFVIFLGVEGDEVTPSVEVSASQASEASIQEL